jgi:hypothetical protein
VESAFGGSLESDSRFCFVASGRNLASVTVKFSHLILFIKTFYKCCTSNKISKNNAATDCITVEQKTGSFPSTFTGLYD